MRGQKTNNTSSRPPSLSPSPPRAVKFMASTVSPASRGRKRDTSICPRKGSEVARVREREGGGEEGVLLPSSLMPWSMR